MPNHINDINDGGRSSRLSIFRAFLKLGLTSFGGPIAHIGYFRDEFVARRKWLSEAAFAELVTLCQLLPGPTSSQVGFLVGLMRGGPFGACLAWLAFTLPSAAVMVLFAYGVVNIDGPYSNALIHGLKLVAVVIVAQAVWGMSRTLTPDRIRISIALISAAVVLLSGHSLFQLVAIISGAAIGMIYCRSHQPSSELVSIFKVERIVGVAALILFFILLFVLPTFSNLSPIVGFIEKFYLTGSLVFGGGHVVLPLLEQEFVAPALIEKNVFLAGYGATQAVPGPLFAFASYLGVLTSNGPGGLVGGLIATVSIFLPGLLLAVGVLPFWNGLRDNILLKSAISGANAAVVGILGAALYQPIWTSSVLHPSDFILVLSGFILLTSWRIPNWAIVVLLPAMSLLISLARL